ncbi:hypothetical protein FRC06_006752 [Ceratobasidium sp. 370]|nr:hypothetical protein FRC06_006752 [Ceratobasidium sp. 370]
MFFARLAVAALSFGSAIKVLAAPIMAGAALSPDPGSIVVANAPIERRIELTFPALIDTTAGALGAIKSEIDSVVTNPAGTVSNELSSILAKVAPLVKPLTERLQAASADEDSLLLAADGVTKLTPEAVGASLANTLDIVNGIMMAVRGLTSLKILQLPLNDIKTELAALDTTLAAVAPELHSIVGDILSTVIGLLGGLLGGLTGGSLGLLAGIPPST